MIIRKICEADIPALIYVCDTCEHLTTERSSIYWLFAKFFYNTSFVSEVEGQIVGILLGFLAPVEPKCGFVHILGVLPDFRGSGIARDLLNRFEEAASDQEAKSICLTAEVENESGKAFYKRVGFGRPTLIDKAGTLRLEFTRPIAIARWDR